MPDLTLPRLADDGTTSLVFPINATATTLELSDEVWAADAAQYPMLVRVDGELISAAGVTTVFGTQTLTGCIRALNGVSKAHPAGTPVTIEYPYRLGLGLSITGGGIPPTITAPTPPASGQTPAPTVPTFNSVSATQITAGQDVAAIIAAGSEGDHFTLLAGAHNINNALLKTGMHVRFNTGATADGTGINNCFGALNQTVTGVAIGGLTSGARPLIANYGNGTSNQRYGAINGFADDPIGGSVQNEDTDDWFIYHLELADNSSNGIFMGSNWTVFDCEIHGHTVTGIGGDRIVGGLIHSCDLYYNGTDGAGGAFGNAANIKLTFVNATKGRTDVAPINRTPAPLVISGCTAQGLDRHGGIGSSLRGIWFDLDCQDVLVEFCTIEDHPNFALLAEGCNNVRFEDNTVRRSDGFGVAFNDDFIAGAVMFGESTNCAARRNIVQDCTRALVNRLSSRADWLTPGQFPIALVADGRLWIDPTTTIPAIGAKSNFWTGNNVFEDNILISCDQVIINEGTDNSGQQPNVQGGTPMATIDFITNDYTQSPGAQFFNGSNTALTLANWQALAFTRDQ